jgi:hypothetical protein
LLVDLVGPTRLVAVRQLLTPAARELGPLGACMPASPDVCAAMGSASRSVTTYACVAGTCSASTSSETAACRRETDGVTCAPEVVTDFGPCSYVDATSWG